MVTVEGAESAHLTSVDRRLQVGVSRLRGRWFRYAAARLLNQRGSAEHAAARPAGDAGVQPAGLPAGRVPAAGRCIETKGPAGSPPDVPGTERQAGAGGFDTPLRGYSTSGTVAATRLLHQQGSAKHAAAPSAGQRGTRGCSINGAAGGARLLDGRAMRVFDRQGPRWSSAARSAVYRDQGAGGFDTRLRRYSTSGTTPVYRDRGTTPREQSSRPGLQWRVAVPRPRCFT